ncbi:hypothetical protein GBA63_19160 [Rubrobacter tropicus]|uniref:Uncharacterized protein n=1 Tax=Rubrobacter tropicus TaxID=2653851 RepID=A0A6G8QDF4_9ACTN|nr:hypothetical protein [Rubrobacter tropicus]QIN84526.1 hypothetical protein GBA63_19160 [Rubrobacter tropicus]
MSLARYELRLLGRFGLATPVLALLLFGGMALLMAFLGANDGQVARVLVAALELGLPLAAGVIAATIVNDDPAIGLQLSLKTRYPRTLVRRLVVLTLWTALIAFLWTSSLHLSGLWEFWVPEPFLVGQLVWLSPLLWFVAAGALLALLLGGRATSGAIIGGLWAFENLMRGLFLTKEWLRPEFLFATTYAAGADFWLTNRLALISTALVMGAVVWVLSSRIESLAKGGEA